MFFFHLPAKWPNNCNCNWIVDEVYWAFFVYHSNESFGNARFEFVVKTNSLSLLSPSNILRFSRCFGGLYSSASN